MAHSDNIVKAKDEVIGVTVKNLEKETLGEICEIMIDKLSGKVVYAVLESGGFLGLGGKLFALPWNAISYDPNESSFILDASKEYIKNAPGFDKNHWPNMADKTWRDSISQYYTSKSYME